MASSGKNKKSIQSSENFLEVLRGLGSGVVNEVKQQVTTAVKSDLPQAFGLGAASSGDLTPNKAFSMEDIKSAEKRGERRGESRMEGRLQQERAVFMRQEQEAKASIQSILLEIRSLTKSTGEFVKEVETAALMMPSNPGIYHKNFYERLRNFIVIMKQKVQESRHWLAMMNSRAQKKGYWGQVKTSGSKFLLSSERYAVTSTG
jgi:hypothetical protein